MEVTVNLTCAAVLNRQVFIKLQCCAQVVWCYGFKPCEQSYFYGTVFITQYVHPVDYDYT